MQPRSQSSKRIQELREQWKAKGKLMSEESLNEFLKRRGSVSFTPTSSERRRQEEEGGEFLGHSHTVIRMCQFALSRQSRGSSIREAESGLPPLQ